MKDRIDCQWRDEMTFDAQVEGFRVTMDAAASSGGRGLGPRPKPLTLASLAGCTGMDVIAILKKMRVNVEYFNIGVEGDTTDEHPKYYHSIHIIYEFKGEGLETEKLQKAIELSQDRYCAVSALLKKGAKVTWEIRILS